jgi:hypothetical protein
MLDGGRARNQVSVHQQFEQSSSAILYRRHWRGASRKPTHLPEDAVEPFDFHCRR